MLLSHHLRGKAGREICCRDQFLRGNRTIRTREKDSQDLREKRPYVPIRSRLLIHGQPPLRVRWHQQDRSSEKTREHKLIIFEKTLTEGVTHALTGATCFFAAPAPFRIREALSAPVTAAAPDTAAKPTVAPFLAVAPMSMDATFAAVRGGSGGDFHPEELMLPRDSNVSGDIW